MERPRRAVRTRPARVSTTPSSPRRPIRRTTESLGGVLRGHRAERRHRLRSAARRLQAVELDGRCGGRRADEPRRPAPAQRGVRDRRPARRASTARASSGRRRRSAATRRPGSSWGLGGGEYGPMRGLAGESTGALTAAFTDPESGLTVASRSTTPPRATPSCARSRSPSRRSRRRRRRAPEHEQPLVELPWSLEQATAKMRELAKCPTPVAAPAEAPRGRGRPKVQPPELPERLLTAPLTTGGFDGETDLHRHHLARRLHRR